MPTLTTTLKDWFDYWLVDHGFLRAYFTNRYELPGPLYRANQPSPGRVRWYKNHLGVKTIVNLRGDSSTNVFFRKEQRACEREGSLDANIQAAELNDLAWLCSQCPQLQAIAHNGGESFRQARHTEKFGLPVVKLPSTSPANASWSFDRKLAAWAEVLLRYGLGPAEKPAA